MVIIRAPPFRGVSSRPHTHSFEKITLTISLTISLSSIGKVGLIFSREEGGGKVLSVKVLILPYAASNAFQFTDNCGDSEEQFADPDYKFKIPNVSTEIWERMSNG